MGNVMFLHLTILHIHSYSVIQNTEFLVVDIVVGRERETERETVVTD